MFNKKGDINLSYNEITLLEGSSDFVNINNYNELQNVNIQIEDDKIASADYNYQNGSITIKGLSFGTTKLKISASGYNDAELIIYVNKPTEDNTFNLSQTNISVFVNEKGVVKINNYKDVDNLQISYSDASVVSTKYDSDNGNLTIMGMKVGTTTLTLSADGFNDATIVVNVQKQEQSSKNIELSTSSLTVKENETGKVEIKNSDDMGIVQITSLDPTIASASYNEGLITVVGIKQGTTSLTVSASGYNDAKISITVDREVQENQDFQLSQTSISVQQGQTGTINVINYSYAKNVKVTSSNQNIVKAKYEDKGYISIEGIGVGSATINVSADGFNDATIEVVVVEKKAIELSQTSISVKTDGQGTIKVNNYSELNNIKITSDNTELISTSYDFNTGIIIINGLKAGVATVTVSADNVESVNIKVTVVGDIELSSLSSQVIIGKNATIQINNYAEINNVKLVSQDEQIATASYDSSNGNIKILGIGVGSTTITVSGQNYDAKTITVKVSEDDEIVLTTDSITTVEGYVNIIYIENYNNLGKISVNSTDTNVATVSYDSSNGRITIESLSKGQAIINVKSVSNSTELEVNCFREFSPVYGDDYFGWTSIEENSTIEMTYTADDAREFYLKPFIDKNSEYDSDVAVDFTLTYDDYPELPIHPSAKKIRNDLWLVSFNVYPLVADHHFTANIQLHGTNLFNFSFNIDVYLKGKEYNK